MDNVLEAQGRFEESMGFHRRCLEQFKKVLGVNHHRVGDICHRIAGHYMRQGLYKDAEYKIYSHVALILTNSFRGYLISSLKIFNSRSYLLNERARTTFRKAKLYSLMGMSTEADKLLLEAYEMRKQLEPKDTRPLEKLEENDFDILVAFWSR
jgi:tetratricopeptide (TPR) repeat protein